MGVNNVIIIGMHCYYIFATNDMILTTISPQMLLLRVHSHYRLGDYERGHFLDKRVQGPLTNFQRTLDAIEADIVDE